MKEPIYQFTEKEAELYEVGNDIALHLIDSGFKLGECPFTPSECKMFNTDGECGNCNLIKLMEAHKAVFEERG